MVSSVFGDISLDAVHIFRLEMEIWGATIQWRVTFIDPSPRVSCQISQKTVLTISSCHAKRLKVHSCSVMLSNLYSMVAGAVITPMHNTPPNFPVE